MNESITDLQMRVTYQDDTIEQLNTIVASQQHELHQIRTELARLRELVQEIKDAQPAAQGDEPLPPHY